MTPLQWRPTAIAKHTMTTSDSGDAILSRLATRNDGETTTVAALAQWLASGECPPYVIRSAAWSILDLVTKPEGWAASGLVQVAHTLHHSLDEHFDAGGNLNTYDRNYADKLRPSRELQKQTRIKLNSVSDVVKAHYIGRLVSRSGGLSPTDEAFTITIRIPDLLTFWNGLPVDDRPRDGFPLEILYVAWLNRPQLVTPNARATGRIIPAKLAHVSPGDRQAGKLFTTAAHVAHIAPETSAETGQLAFSGFQQPTTPRQFILPEFKESTAIGPCLPLALYDLGDAPSTSRGPAAPLSLRLFVESVLAVPLDSRDSYTPVAMRVTLRQMLNWLYPSRRKPRPNEYWPRLMAALEALESPAARIPWYDPETGQGGSRRIVNISDIPRGPAKLDDLISIIVDLPPGSGNGPQVSDNLRQWGIKSAAGYRALLNLAYRWFEPGRTHFPVGRGRRRYWTQVSNPERYPPLTEDEIIALCFPTSARSARRNVLSDARKVIRQLEQSGELRVVEGRGNTMRILPPTIDVSPCG